MKNGHNDHDLDVMIKTVNRIGSDTEFDRAALILAVNNIVPDWGVF